MVLSWGGVFQAEVKACTKTLSEWEKFGGVCVSARKPAWLEQRERRTRTIFSFPQFFPNALSLFQGAIQVTTLYLVTVSP